MDANCFVCGSLNNTSTGKCTNVKCPRYKCSVMITVTDSSGSVLSGVTVSYSGGSATTNSSGQATFSKLAVGTYEITAVMTGYASATASVTAVAGASVSATIALTASTTTKDSTTSS